MVPAAVLKSASPSRPRSTLGPCSSDVSLYADGQAEFRNVVRFVSSRNDQQVFSPRGQNRDLLEVNSRSVMAQQRQIVAVGDGSASPPMQTYRCIALTDVRGPIASLRTAKNSGPICRAEWSEVVRMPFARLSLSPPRRSGIRTPPVG